MQEIYINISYYITMTDIELVNNTLEDKNQFKEIIKLFEQPLRRYIKRLLYLSFNDIDDILQESFIQIYRNLNSYDSSYKLSSWIYRITHNVAISYLRKNKKHIKVVLDLEELDSIAKDEDMRISNDLDKDMINRALDKLDDKYKEVLVLKYIEEKDYNEISDILKIGSGTVGSLINRGKFKLKEIIENEKRK